MVSSVTYNVYNRMDSGNRKNTVLLKMAKCLVVDLSLPPSLWDEAVSTSNYIRKGCPTNSLD